MNKFIITLCFMLVLLAHLIIINTFRINQIEQNQEIQNSVVALQLSKIEIKKELPKEEVLTQKNIEKPKNNTKALKPIEKSIPIKKEIIKPTTTSIIKEETSENKEIQETKKSEESATKQEQINKENIYIQNYILQLREEINKNKTYPMISRKLKEQGKVIISFRVQNNGLFDNILVKSSCNIKRLDEAALNALYTTKKFKAFDKEINKEYMDFDVPLEFITIN